MTAAIADTPMIDIQPHATLPGAYTLRTQQWLPQPLDEVFDFFADAGRLQDLTPPFLNFRILTPMPIEMHEGAIIDYSLRLHSIPIHWKTEITAWDPPYRFVDEQLRGPYRLWRHEHTFRERDGGTEVCDQVDYAVPGGRLIQWLLVRHDLQRIFQFRRQQLAAHFGNDDHAG